MPFQIEFIKALVSNKPHPPEPEPTSPLFPIKKVLPDGRTVWVSVPQPDRLTITVPISADIYAAKVPKSMPPGEFANGLFAYFKSEPFNAHYKTGAAKKMPQEPGAWKAWYHITLLMGSRQGQVRFELLWDIKYGIRLRFECNPRKLGPIGFEQLANVLAGPQAPFDLPRLVSAARVSRLDLCVDVVGVRMSELLLWYKLEGKRSLYVGSDGVLETVQIHRKLPPTKPPGVNGPPKKTSNNPTGQVQLKAYDRVRERLSAQKWPPFGPAPVLRLERPLYRFGQKSLASLPHLDNKLIDFRAGFVLSQLPKPVQAWFRYVAARRTMSEQEACTLLGVPAQMAARFRAAELVPKSDLLSANEVWEYWKVGLAHTGLLKFLQSA